MGSTFQSWLLSKLITPATTKNLFFFFAKSCEEILNPENILLLTVADFFCKRMNV